MGSFFRILSLILFVICLVHLLINLDATSFNTLWFKDYELPLSLILAVFFICGILCGVLFILKSYFNIKQKSKTLTKDLSEANKKLTEVQDKLLKNQSSEIEKSKNKIKTTITEKISQATGLLGTSSGTLLSNEEPKTKSTEIESTNDNNQELPKDSSLESAIDVTNSDIDNTKKNKS